MTSRLISPFAPGTTLDPEQGGTGVDLASMPLGSLLIGSGGAPVIGNLIGGAGVTVDSSVVGELTIEVAPSDTADNLAGGGAGEVVYQSAADTTAFLPAGNLGDILIATGAPGIAWLPGSSVAGTQNIGYLNVPSVPKSADYSTILTDVGKSIDHSSTDDNPRTFTIDAAVAYALGDVISFSNLCATQDTTIALSAGTLLFAVDGTTGSRTLAPGGMATARLAEAGIWQIAGPGLT